MADDNSDFHDAIDWRQVKPGKGDDWATTMMVGEEGEPDPYPGEVTTMALGEEGDGWVLEPEPIMTTMALGEEGDDPFTIL
jgi:hypothetical protein